MAYTGKTAKDVSRENIAAIKEDLAKIAAYIAKQSEKGSFDWGDAGSLGFVAEHLGDVVSFINNSD